MNTIKHVLTMVLTMIGMFFLLPCMAQAEDIVYNFVYPVGSEGELVGYHISQGFNTTSAEGYCSVSPYTQAPSNCPGTWRYGHDGLDISNYACYSPVYASAAGVVTNAELESGWGNQIRIRHLTSDGYRYTLYGHLDSMSVSEGDSVNQGQQIGTIGNGGVSTACHLHFGVLTEDINGSGYYYSSMPLTHIDPTDFIESHQIPTSAYNAITAKADLLWYPNGNLIFTETSNMHWYAGATATNNTYIIEDWTNGTWGNVAITFDPDNTNQTTAYVLRHGFWTYYKANGGPNAFGAPLGDEMDTTRLDEYVPYDPYCNAHHGTDYAGCIAEYCYNADDFTSMQRFSTGAVFCWNPGIYEICQPNADGESLTCETKNLRYDPDTGRQIMTDTDPDPTGPSGTNSWLDSDGIFDDQYLFIDVNQDGFHDPCVRQGTTLYCDQDMNGQHDWVITYGSGGAEYFSNGTGVTVRWPNNANWYNDTDSDSITNRVISYGNGLNETQRCVGRNAVAVRWGDEIYLDSDLNGVTNTHVTWQANGETMYLAEMNGDGNIDLVRQSGNAFYIDTNRNGQADYWFTYGYVDGSDRYYFADMDGDGRDDILVQRCLVDCNWFLVLNNTSIQTSGASNNHDWDFTYGHGLPHPIYDVDQDNDGYTPNQGDCNDLSNGVYPGHSEIADGVDNDCDGLIDEGIVVNNEHQYLFYDANRDGQDDVCVYRYEDLILCDTNLDGYHDVSFHYGNSGAEYFAGGHTLCARFGAWFYCDQTADGVSEVGFTIGNGGNDDYQFGYNAAAVRYGGTTYFETNQSTGTDFAIVWGGNTGWPYYLADMDGDGVVDMIRRSGNTYYVNTNRDSYTNWWFSYGNSSDDVYFADMDGDGRADPMVRRCAMACNRFLVKYNVNLQLNGVPNYHDMEFTYGWGLP